MCIRDRLVLDVSGSMKGRKWAKLKNCLKTFAWGLVRSERDHSMSIVTFSDKGRIALLCESMKGELDVVRDLGEPGGETSYSEGLWKAGEVLENSSAEKKIAVLFMSDGKPTDDEDRYKMSLRQFKERWGSKIHTTGEKSLFWTVFMQDKSDGEGEYRSVEEQLCVGILEGMAREMKGEFKDAKNLNELERTFVQFSGAERRKRGGAEAKSLQ
eukprot:TRINITY_DN10991_c0_g1_i2.p1 TRINITY_DN10991_c0_g1~~TRINITY_DN10991_c0_g1_i2.p1  ORF type:complete len:246 (+),score=48.30 TRINITY_DN10991_c0_g1_i2:100-738(+)